MSSIKNLTTRWFPIILLSGFLLTPGTLAAHCDALDGPVVQAAQKALQTGNVNLVLLWVREQDEAAIKQAFTKTLAVRKIGTEAKELADMYFFETLVRIHRAGEGAPYTGLKPAGLDMGPAIPAADKALQSGSLSSLSTLLTTTIQQGLHQSFEEALEKRNFKTDDLAAGRAYIQAYVTFVHYVEGVYEAALLQSHGHTFESSEVKNHEEVH